MDERYNLPLFICRVNAAADELHVLQLTDAGQNILPRTLEVVPVGNSNVEERFDSIHVFRLHFTEVVEECEFAQSRDEGISLQLKIEVTSDANGVLESIQAQLRCVLRVSARWLRRVDLLTSIRPAHV